MNPNYYRGSKGAVIVYDVTDKDSLEKAKAWHRQLNKYLDGGTPIMIAGNKCDILARAVDEAEAEAFARSVQAEHINTSAKSGQNVKECFTRLANSKSATPHSFRNFKPAAIAD